MSVLMVFTAFQIAKVCSYFIFDKTVQLHYTFSECNCNSSGSKNSVCNKGTGKCPCKYGFNGHKCEECDGSFYGFPNCESMNMILLSILCVLNNWNFH